MELDASWPGSSRAIDVAHKRVRWCARRSNVQGDERYSACSCCAAHRPCRQMHVGREAVNSSARTGSTERPGDGQSISTARLYSNAGQHCLHRSDTRPGRQPGRIVASPCNHVTECWKSPCWNMSNEHDPWGLDPFEWGGGWFDDSSSTIRSRSPRCLRSQSLLIAQVARFGRCRAPLHARACQSVAAQALLQGSQIYLQDMRACPERRTASGCSPSIGGASMVTLAPILVSFPSITSKELSCASRLVVARPSNAVDSRDISAGPFAAEVFEDAGMTEP